ncbi:hypothetical protein [Xanthomonas bundabergensis]|uniref:hypothetical protein n=1 Tax=Xanthomonas bundabergensis TaxID=3160842 RepID=UPI003516CED7
MDKFILASVDFHWQKVAMVIAGALADSDFEFPEADDDASLVAEHVQVLVSLGQLEARGDTSNWRFSEVRKVAAESAHGRSAYAQGFRGSHQRSA